jgi:xanthine dehydrogenase YagR molybdenum-binding subunit
MTAPAAPGFMRSPPVVPYIYALESAIDELALKLDMDPVELRRINDTMTDPIDGKPYSSRSLMKCYDEAAAAFGWKRREARPGSMRDGQWLIGWGCATAVYPTHVGAVTARVRLLPNEQVRVQTAAHEIGNGVYTVLAQLAAERLGVPLSQDKAFEPHDIRAMSMALDEVCQALKLDGNAKAREIAAIRIIELAQRGERSPTRLRDRVLQEANGGTGC